ncbi:RecQ family ATP-dependent DNA helicase [Williamwhitmania taraxaci]|uniref:ATP-dependent DNA helicase RecQ n=1 Tax=Williamwhitmania taraxaci TaxID=1640674 RepID=A0A1G6M4D8_9BACT|nr:ATP-dependent DNA helicase RecQ [Williamwhitmania taraxaci]SDC50363.1 ATP-dependent DNA helicase RecQ [Williamwhitmania taraxaci]
MEQFNEILLRYWGYSQFRPMQKEIIQSVFEGKDTLALLPTGGGKSICFQVPAMAMEGICLVVSPLIALMKDQVENLEKKGIKALSVHSGMSRREIDIILENATTQRYKFLYLSPERLSTQLFTDKLRGMTVSMIAVDEAHCISQWGYDFRPNYMKISEIRELLPNVPILALTATATPAVVEDIQEKLRFRKKNIIKKSFERKNLVYVVRETEDKQKLLVKLIEKIPGCGIVYVRNRQSAKETAALLVKNGFSADYYHAGLGYEARSTKQNNWKQGKTRIIVSTNAFGMGIDKSDVRFVVHTDLPDSPEAYFQEAGRAGRDEKTAFAILLFSPSDRNKLEQRIETSFPPIEEIKLTYQSLCNYLQIPIGAGKDSVHDFKLQDFAAHYKFNALRAYNSLKILQMEGYLELTDEVNNPSKLMFIMERDELYKLQVANPDIDKIIKLLLRTYPGLFSGFVKIEEETLGKRAGIAGEKMQELLKQMERMRVIYYFPKKRTPLLIMMEERLDQKNIRISPETYLDRKTRFKQRIEATLQYAECTTVCRSQQLLAYFGETSGKPCGLCDVCKALATVGLTAEEERQIKSAIQKLLLDQPISAEALVDSIPFSPEKSLEIIRWLLDKSMIKTDNGLLYWSDAQ